MCMPFELLTKTKKNTSTFKVLIFNDRFSQTEHIEVQHKHIVESP